MLQSDRIIKRTADIIRVLDRLMVKWKNSEFDQLVQEALNVPSHQEIHANVILMIIR